MQQKITKPSKLLNELGELTQKGYATELLLDYDRLNIKAGSLRIKEWDYYYVGNNNYGIALTIADNSYMGLISVSLLDFRTKYKCTKIVSSIMPKGKTKLPSSSKIGDVCFQNKKGVVVDFKNNGVSRNLICTFPNFDNGETLNVDIKLGKEPAQSMVIATPFANDSKAFYYNQKINCMQASGSAKIGDKIFNFGKDSLGTLDWGRGVWTYKNTWYWGSLSTIIDTHTFGFNIGYGFGDTSCATEDMLFYDGVAHKIEAVKWEIPTENGKENFLQEWHFRSKDERLIMKFEPILNRYSNTNALILCSVQNQVFGQFSGTAILDDGSVIKFTDRVGFAEKVFNKW